MGEIDYIVDKMNSNLIFMIKMDMGHWAGDRAGDRVGDRAGDRAGDAAGGKANYIKNDDYSLMWICDRCTEEEQLIGIKNGGGKACLSLRLNYKGFPLYIYDYDRIVHHYKRFHLEAYTLFWLATS
jgi:hypothetical protein